MWRKSVDCPASRKEGFEGQRLYRLPQSVLQRVEAKAFIRDFVVSDLGFFPLAPGHRVERPEGTESHILIFVISGHGWCQQGALESLLEKGQVLWIPAGMPHRYGADHEEPWSIYWMHFSGKGAEELLTWLPLHPEKPVLHGCPLATIKRHFHAILDQMESGYGNRMLLGLSDFLVSMLTLLHRQSGSSPHLGGEIVEAIMNLMRQTTQAPLALEEYAQKAGYSVAQFSKLFQSYAGTSPMKYLMELRMQRACELLDCSSRSVKEIAAALGFHDPFYFSRAFKREMGMAPSQWRTRPH